MKLRMGFLWLVLTVCQAAHVANVGTTQSGAATEGEINKTIILVGSMQHGKSTLIEFLYKYSGTEEALIPQSLQIGNGSTACTTEFAYYQFPQLPHLEYPLSQAQKTTIDDLYERDPQEFSIASKPKTPATSTWHKRLNLTVIDTPGLLCDRDVEIIENVTKIVRDPSRNVVAIVYVGNAESPFSGEMFNLWPSLLDIGDAIGSHLFYVHSKATYNYFRQQGPSYSALVDERKQCFSSKFKRMLGDVLGNKIADIPHFFLDSRVNLELDTTMIERHLSYRNLGQLLGHIATMSPIAF